MNPTAKTLAVALMMAAVSLAIAPSASAQSVPECHEVPFEPDGGNFNVPGIYFESEGADGWTKVAATPSDVVSFARNAGVAFNPACYNQLVQCVLDIIYGPGCYL